MEYLQSIFAFDDCDVIELCRNWAICCTSATPAKWMIAGETLVALRNGLTTCIH